MYSGLRPVDLFTFALYVPRMIPIMRLLLYNTLVIFGNCFFFTNKPSQLLWNRVKRLDLLEDSSLFQEALKIETLQARSRSKLTFKERFKVSKEYNVNLKNVQDVKVEYMDEISRNLSLKAYDNYDIVLLIW